MSGFLENTTASHGFNSQPNTQSATLSTTSRVHHAASYLEQILCHRALTLELSNQMIHECDGDTLVR